MASVCLLAPLLAAPAEAQTLPPGPAEEPAKAPVAKGPVAKPRAEPAAKEPATEPSPAAAPWMLGVHLDYAFWSDKGLPENSTGVGARLGYRYTPGMELEVRGRYIKSGSTGISSSTGWAASAANLWFVRLAPAWELGIGVGGGYEVHKTKLRTNRTFLHGRVAPLVRWSLSSALALDVGPEAGVGVMSSDGSAGAEQSDDFVFRYGGFVNLSWRWGGGASATEESTSSSDDSW